MKVNINFKSILKIAKLFEEIAFKKLAKDMTLYHGTSINRAKSIMENGLIPQVGDWVRNSYGTHMDLDSDSEDYAGMYEAPNFDITFATDKSQIGKAVGGMIAAIAAEEGKDFHDVTPEDIRASGAIIVINEAYDPNLGNDNSSWNKKPEKYDEEWEMYNNYPTAEPGDYINENAVSASRILSGEPMIRLLRKHNEWPIIHGLNDIAGAGKRELLIKMVRKENSDVDIKEIINKIDNLNAKQIDDYYYSLKAKQK